MSSSNHDDPSSPIHGVSHAGRSAEPSAGPGTASPSGPGTASPGGPGTDQTLPSIALVTTGGTIAGAGANHLDLANYKVGHVPPEALIATVPEIAGLANLQPEQVSNIDSSEMTPAVWLMLAKRINALLADPSGPDGVVVTHGTDTMEETSYFLNLTIKSDKPVVMVGAQRPPTALSADGPINLYNGVRVAVAPESVGKGVLVLMHDEIHAARDVAKTNTYRSHAFQSGQLGLLGYADPDGVVYYRQTTRAHTEATPFDVADCNLLPKVEIITSYADADSHVYIDALMRNGTQGIVLAGLGAGNPTPRALESLATATAAGVPVVRSSVVPNGRVIDLPRYRDLGIVAGDNLSANKARILLMLALQKDPRPDPETLRQCFDRY